MKKFVKLATTLVAVLFVVACSGSKNKEESRLVEPPKPVTATFSYGYSVSSDLFKATTIDVYFTDASGKEVHEKMTTTSWSKQLKDVKPSFVGKMRIVYTLVQDFEPTRAQHTFSTTYKLAYETTAGSSDLNDKSNSMTLSKNMVKGYLEAFVKEPYIYSLEVK
ncbi:hypothetical protein BN938_1673 [Mucinivorans hirudinis]|uniref:Lipoprotein n=1 Tax=Mucinivorans hirudinis TaxID=1433126 RepID=A0A060RCY4_9BACT|nr:hypothetical protein BN938_1673 [Mucinivorans hirudinis]